MFVFVAMFVRIGYLGAALWIGPYYLLTRGNALPVKLARLSGGIVAFYALVLALICITAVFDLHRIDVASHNLSAFYARQLPELLLFHFLPLSLVVVLAYLFRKKPTYGMLPICLLLNITLLYSGAIALLLKPGTILDPIGETDVLIESLFKENPFLIVVSAIPFQILLWLVFATAWWVQKVSEKQNIAQPDAP